MVDILKKEIHLQGKVFRITSFETWWSVEGLGLFASLEDVSREVPPESVNLLNVRPVPVAVSDTVGVYEPL